VTLHCFFEPRLVAVQVSAVFENADELPAPNPTTRERAGETPVLFNTNVCDVVVFMSIVPKSFEPGVNAIDGVPPPVAVATPTVSASTAQHTNRILSLITEPPSP
jgi:hypothetical protein